MSHFIEKQEDVNVRNEASVYNIPIDIRSYNEVQRHRGANLHVLLENYQTNLQNRPWTPWCENPNISQLLHVRTVIHENQPFEWRRSLSYFRTSNNQSEYVTYTKKIHDYLKKILEFGRWFLHPKRLKVFQTYQTYISQNKIMICNNLEELTELERVIAYYTLNINQIILLQLEVDSITLNECCKDIDQNTIVDMKNFTPKCDYGCYNGHHHIKCATSRSLRILEKFENKREMKVFVGTDKVLLYLFTAIHCKGNTDVKILPFVSTKGFVRIKEGMIETKKKIKLLLKMNGEFLKNCGDTISKEIVTMHEKYQKMVNMKRKVDSKFEKLAMYEEKWDQLQQHCYKIAVGVAKDKFEGTQELEKRLREKENKLSDMSKHVDMIFKFQNQIIQSNVSKVKADTQKKFEFMCRMLEEKRNEIAQNLEKRVNFVDSIEKRLEDAEKEMEKSICKICFEKPFSAAFIPCGHACICKKCAKKIGDKCPFCKQHVHDVIVLKY